MGTVPAVSQSQVRAVESLQDLVGEYSLTIDGTWTILAHPASDTDAATGAIGSPGLWKILTGGRFSNALFEAPRCIVDAMNDDDEGDARISALQRFVQWGKSTADGSAASNWSPPTTEQLAAWCGAERLTVQFDGGVSQGRIVRSDATLSLVFPIVLNVPKDLPDHRRRALAELLDDAHHSWRMVRVAMHEAGQQSGAVAEVNLTGAPLPIVEPLMRYATDALRHVVRWAGPTANLLASEKRCPLVDQ